MAPPPKPPSVVAYCTDSAGMNQQAHTLLNKIRIISRTKYTHIELGWSDLEAYVKSAGLAGSDEERLVKAAKDVRTLCNDLEIGILAVHT